MPHVSQLSDSFASLLGKWADRQRLTPELAAVRLGVSKQTAYNWLHGAPPPNTRIPRLAADMGIPAATLRRAIDRDRAARHAADPKELQS